MSFYVAPDGVVKLLKGVPCDLEYEHTLWFANAAAQQTYFNSKVVKTFSNVTYVRKNRGVIKVQAAADTIYDCDYLMYQNTGFNQKWFYAFILSVEYVSNNVSRITFVIDEMQTWFFEMQLKQCYVEREHANHDVAGDNLLPEGLETGEYIYRDNDYDWCHIFTSYDVIIYTTFSSSYNGSSWIFTNGGGSYTWGIYSGLNIRIFREVEYQTTIDSITSFISAVVAAGKENGIVAMLMIPHEALDNNYLPTQISHTIPKITAIDGYTPVNKKLLTAPYVFIEADNCEGAVAVLPQEYFSSITTPTVCQFMITFNITCAPVALCVPINYKGSEYCYTEGLYINNFPQCSYNTDLFKAYMAQSLTAKIGQVVTDAISGVGVVQDLKPTSNGGVNANGAYNSVGDLFRDLASGGKYSSGQYSTEGRNSGGTGAIGDIYNALANIDAVNQTVGSLIVGGVMGDDVRGRIYSDLSQMYAKSVQAPHNTGANTPDYLTSNRLKGFWFFQRTIRREYAERIDKYFSRYGYATKLIKVPNIHVRERWTYTKTIGAEIEGNIPIDAKTQIKNIFNHGITFWSDTANVGDYSLSNNII